MEELNGSKTQLSAIIITVIITAIVFGGGVYLLTTKNKIDDQANIAIVPTKIISVTPTVAPSVSTSVTTATDETANWKTYTNTTTGFSIKYPTTFSYALSSEVGRGVLQTITFGENPQVAGRVIVYIINSTTTVAAPDGMDPTATADITIAGKAGKKYTTQDGMAYVFADSKYRYEIVLSDVRTTTQDIATSMIDSITLSN